MASESYYYKKVGEQEATLLLEANAVGITPKVYEIVEGVVKMERYPFTLTQLIKGNSPNAIIALNELRPLIARLHALGIYHGDLHSDNIVYKDHVALIDFGLSCRIDTIDEKFIDDLYDDQEYDWFEDYKKIPLAEKVNILLEEELDKANSFKRIFKYDEASGIFKHIWMLR